MDAFWLLTEGVSVAAGGGAKVDGDHDHERSLRLQLVVVVLLDRENTALQERFDEAASPVTSDTTGENHQQGTSLAPRTIAAFVSCHKRNKRGRQAPAAC